MEKFKALVMPQEPAVTGHPLEELEAQKAQGEIECRIDRQEE
jgi:hypothetical protein